MYSWEAFDPAFCRLFRMKDHPLLCPAVVYLTCAKLLDVSQYDLSSMEMFVLGGSPIAEEDINLILDKFGIRGKNKLQQVYGFTESGPTGLALFPEEIEIKTRGIGRAGVVGSETIIVDPKATRLNPGSGGTRFAEESRSSIFKDPKNKRDHR